VNNTGVNTRSSPSSSGTFLGTHTTGDLGTVNTNTQNGIYADGYYWWNVNFDSGVDGWMAETYLTLYTSTPVNGVCSATLNACSLGTFSDQADTSTNYLWSCVGSGGGTTALCSLPTTAEALPCYVEPKTIRAYSVADSNSIRLAWPKNDYRQELHIARRVYSNHPSAWQTWVPIYSVITQANEAGQHIDTNVSSGIHYEYQIRAFSPSWTCTQTAGASGTAQPPYWAYQYINTGTQVPLKDQRGKVILLVESGLATSLSAEIARLENDLIGDGYKVYRHDVAASEVTAPGWKTSVANTKALVRADYNTDTSADWTIFIVGHVPIPYSGLSSPGGHTENYGAHPADWYYADMDEALWTDTTVNNSTATKLPPDTVDYSWNWNVPGDGKFDQSRIPSAPEMRIGRVDLKNMPAFGKSEVELMRQYLDRDHAWRHKQFTVRDRGLINSNNNVGLLYYGLPPDSHSSYSSFFGGISNTDIGSWLGDATNPANSYLFAASAGNGVFTKDHQIGTTQDFAATPLYVVFATMHGSYYGHWDSAMHPNIVIQAPLADEGYVVSNYYHEDKMNIDSSAMGEPIGQELFTTGSNGFITPFGVRYTNYEWVYDGQSYFAGYIMNNYVTLLGDPTLRTRVVAPPTNVTVSANGADNVISWTGAADTNIQGYHVYRAPTTNLNDFRRITSAPVAAGSYRDVNAAAGAYRYMVRTVKLEQSANRSYFNASQGIFATGI